METGDGGGEGGGTLDKVDRKGSGIEVDRTSVWVSSCAKPERTHGHRLRTLLADQRLRFFGCTDSVLLGLSVFLSQSISILVVRQKLRGPGVFSAGPGSYRSHHRGQPGFYACCLRPETSLLSKAPYNSPHPIDQQNTQGRPTTLNCVFNVFYGFPPSEIRRKHEYNPKYIGVFLVPSP